MTARRQPRRRPASQTPAAAKEKTKVRILEERDRLVSLWTSQEKSPAEIVAMYRSHVESEMLRIAGGPGKLEAWLDSRRAVGLRFNTPESIRKRTLHVRQQRRDPGTGRFIRTG